MPNKDNRRAQKNPRSGDRPTKTRAGRSATVRSDEGEAMTTPAQPNATKPVPDPGGKLPSSVREPSPIASSRSLKDGYTSLLDVTKAPRADFVAATHDTLGGFKAAQLYEMARAQLSFH